MRKSQTKKEIIAAYKEKKTVGGIYLIRNTKSDRLFLDATSNIQGICNRFDFVQKTGTCFNIKLKKEWTASNKGDFKLEILEELEMGNDLTKKAFKDDLETLKGMWQEKLANECFF